MKLLHPVAVLLFALFSFQIALSQTILITFENPDALSVCNSDTFIITVRNLSAQVANNGSLTINLPNGLVYEPSTVSGATESNISNAQTPVFTFPPIAVGALQTIKVLLNADCNAAKVLDTGQLFIANLAVQTSAGNAQALTTSIPVETGLVLFDSVDPQFSSGERFDTINREICVINTRSGPISKLFFEDSHQVGIEIVVANAQNVSQTPIFYKNTFSGAFLAGFGDGDALLEQGEKVCFIEKVIITDCGTPEYNNQSRLRIGWGCDESMCRYDSLLAGIDIKESTRVPNLKMAGIWNPPADYCASLGAIAGIKIKNIGAGNAKDVLLRLKVSEQEFVGIEPTSIRLVSANGTVTPLPPSVVLPKTIGDCNKSFGKDITLVLPFVAAKDSTTLLFDYYNCSAECNEILPTFQLEYFYQKPCPPNGFVSDGLVIAPDIAYKLRQKLQFSANSCLQDNTTYPFQYKISSKRLTEANGVLKIVMELPNGMELSGDCPLLLGGVAPTDTTLVPAPDRPISTLTLTYPLPLSAETDLLVFCLKYTCDTTVFCVDDTTFQDVGGTVINYDPTGLCSKSCVTPFPVRTYWLPKADDALKCGANTCEEIFLSLSQNNCKPDDGDPNPLDTLIAQDTFLGHFVWKMDAYRLNYDLPDLDNNRIADGPGQAKGINVARRRYLSGDTMRVEFRIYVDSGVGMRSFTRSIIQAIYKSDIGVNDNDSFNILLAKSVFSNQAKFRLLSDSVRVRYADGAEYKALYKGINFPFDENYVVIKQVNTYPSVILDEVSYYANLSAIRLDTLFNQGLLPKASIGKGDSLFIYADYKLDFNFIPPSDNNPNPPLVGFRTSGNNLGFGFTANNNQFTIPGQYSGFKTSWTNSAYSLKPCQNSAQVKPFNFRLRIARGNMFPFEVRPLATIRDYNQSKPLQANVVNAQLKYLALQDSMLILSNATLPFTQNSAAFDLNFDNAFSNPIDEGFFFSTEVTFGPDCSFGKPDTSLQHLTIGFKPGMTTPDSLVEQKFNTLGYFSNQPRLQLNSNDTIVYITKKDFDLDFTIRNSVASPAPNMWVNVVSPSGNASSFQLFQLPQLQSIAKQNNIFQLNNLNGFNANNYRLTGINTSCVSDSLLIIYGWNCSQVTNVSPEICGIDSFWVVLRKESPEIEMDIRAEPASIQICEESDYYEVELYNAKTGYAYDLDLSVNLPPGLDIVPGSCQISYPAGSPYVPLANPVNSNGLFQWDINSVQAAIALNGLPGIDQAPKNALKIRFKTLANCGFVANAQPIFGATGFDPCGSATNTLNKPASSLTVNGLNPSYGVIMELNPTGTPMLYCGGTQQYKVRTTLLGKPSGTDSIYVLLPASLQYVSGSYTPGQNAPIGTPSTTQEGFRVVIPSNLDNGSVIEFTFSVQIQTGAGCGNDLIIAQSRVSTAAFCATLGTNCTVYFATGTAILPFQIAHPQLDITDANIQNINNTLQVKVNVRNIGTVPAQGVQIQLWYDQNGDGLVSANDLLITTGSVNNTLNPSGNITINLPALSTLPDLCNLIVVLPADENCTCSDQLFPLKNLQVVAPNEDICSIKAVQVGIPAQNGFQYQWSVPNGSVQCATCASTEFTPPAGAQAGYSETISLLATGPNCSVEYQFTYTFGFPFTLKPNNQTLCEGKQLVLSVTPTGATYTWAGPGVTNNNAATQVLYPIQTGTYSVTVTRSNGCTADTSMLITVLPSDTIQLPALITCQGEPINILGQNTSTAGTYNLLLQKQNGCDSLIRQQLIVKPSTQTQSTQQFCKGDTLKVYNQVFVQNGGQACTTNMGINGCDSTHCVNVVALDPPLIQSPDTIYGQILQNITLTGAGGFNQYAWTPALPDCANCPGGTVRFDTAGYYEYILVISDDQGCGDTVVYRIVVFPPCDAKNVRIPNAFTPNGDGTNDTFKVVDREGAEVVGGIQIYDRWGEKVYESTTQLYWDGTIDGKPAPNDVYVYIIQIICGDSPEKLVGDVTLLR